MTDKRGRGRPKIDPQYLKIPVAYKIPRWLVEWMRAEDKPCSQLIEEAITEKHKLKPPS